MMRRRRRPIRRRFTYSRTSPTNDRRACLCPDGTYSRECCDGSLQAQGIGSVTDSSPPVSEGYTAYHITNCDDGHHKNAHYHGSLDVGTTYYMTLENGQEGCYTVDRERNFEGVEIITSVGIPFDDCAECTALNSQVLDPEGDPAPECTDRVLVIQICNDNSVTDDNFDIYLNGTKIGDVDLNADAQIGSLFIASSNTDLTITDPDFVCELDDMVVHRFNPDLLYSGTNTLYLKNTQDNGSANAFTIGVRNYEVSGNNLINACNIKDMSFNGGFGANFFRTFSYTQCCP